MRASDIYKIREFDRFYTRILKLADKYHLNTHLTLLEARVLIEVNRGVGQTAELTQLLQLDKGYLSRILKKLEDTGLVVRQKDERDRRFKMLRLTAAGERALATIDNRADEQVIRLFGNLPDDELQRLLAAMARIQADVGAATGVTDPGHAD